MKELLILLAALPHAPEAMSSLQRVEEGAEQAPIYLIDPSAEKHEAIITIGELVRSMAENIGMSGMETGTSQNEKPLNSAGDETGGDMTPKNSGSKKPQNPTTRLLEWLTEIPPFLTNDIRYIRYRNKRDMRAVPMGTTPPSSMRKIIKRVIYQ